MPAAEPHERAGLLSLVYVISYLGLGLPAVLAGVLVVYGGGLHATAQEYGAGVLVLATAALLGFRPRHTWPEPGSVSIEDADPPYA